MMELDVKLAPQCMEVGSAGLHTAAAASAGGGVKTSIVGQVSLCFKTCEHLELKLV